MDPIHDTRRRFDVRFHLVAIAFLVFDVEVLFLFPWAVAARPAPEPTAAASGENARPAATIPEAPSGTATAAQPTNRPPLGIDAAVQGGLVESRHLVFGGVMVFVLLLAVGFVYDVRKGVFQWR